MPQIELATRPKTASRHRPTGVICSDVLEAFSRARKFDRVHASRFVFHVAAESQFDAGDAYSDDWHVAQDPDLVVLMAGHRQLTTVHFGCHHIDYSQTVVDLAQVWADLRDATFTSCAMYPATGQQNTQRIVGTSDDVLESRKLDAAFAALMNYVPESDDVGEHEERPTIRYRFPR